MEGTSISHCIYFPIICKLHSIHKDALVKCFLMKIIMYKYHYILLRELREINQIPLNFSPLRIRLMSIRSVENLHSLLKYFLVCHTTHLSVLFCCSPPHGLLPQKLLIMAVHCHNHIFCHWPPTLTLYSMFLLKEDPWPLRDKSQSSTVFYVEVIFSLIFLTENI